MPSGVNRTRQVIIEKLGGPFDYTQFQEDLRGIMVEKEILDRQFKSEMLNPPEFQKGQKLPDYDFSSSIFSKDLFSSTPF